MYAMIVLHHLFICINPSAPDAVMLLDDEFVDFRAYTNKFLRFFFSPTLLVLLACSTIHY